MRHVLLAILIASAPLAAQTTTMAVPAGAAMDAYPIMPEPLTVRDMARLRVRPVTLDSSWTGYNWYRDKKRFVYETLSEGTIVLVDTAGVVRYKADCGNRLVAPAECPRCLGAFRTDTASTMAEVLGGSVTSSRNLSAPADSAASAIKKAALAVWRWVADRIAEWFWLLVLLAGVLLIPLIIWALWRLFQTRGTSGSNHTSPPTTPPVAPVAPVAPTPPVPGPTAVPVPTPVAPVSPSPASGRRFVNYEAPNATSPAMVRFSGFTTARMEEADGVVTIRIS